MGYTTEFSGKFSIDRPVTDELANYVNRFSSVRHMKRDVEKLKKIYPDWDELCYKGNIGTQGEYFAVKSKNFGQDYTEDILDYNTPPETQPGLWCQWIIPEDDHAAIEWDGGEKFYNYEEWLKYLINHFLASEGYTVNGNVSFQGEDPDDFGMITVKDNEVKVINGEQHFYGKEKDLGTFSDDELIEECEKRGLL